MDLPEIAVFPRDGYSRCQRTFDALASLYDVVFVPTEEASLASHRFAWLIGASRDIAKRVAVGGAKVLAFCDQGETSISEPSAKVELGTSDDVPASFRGCSLEDVSLTRASQFEAKSGDNILARKAEALIWIRNLEVKGAVDFVAVPLPALQADEHLFDYFHHGSWAALLPALQFLKEVSPWTPPPLRACFMFDDPNLHWKSYGYADYGELAKQAREHQYHVTFAAVPIDGWYVNRTAASLFQENKDRLSLLIHGNNHTACELTSTQGEENCRGLAVQAISRIQKLEEKAGFDVPRVMAAPHGACNHEMADALLGGGFEAACISRGSIMGRNPGLTWPVTIGLEVTEFLGKALPVIPRFNIRLDRGSEFSARLAAFLGQPVIPVGHHDDLGKGFGLLSGLAELINSWGDVKWVDMNAMAESNFCTHQDENSDLLEVKMYSRRIRLTVAEGVTQIRVHRPWVPKGDDEALTYRTSSSEEGVEISGNEPISVSSGDEIEISSVDPRAFDSESVKMPRTPLWAMIRRQLCELRDRMRPLKDRFLHSKS